MSDSGVDFVEHLGSLRILPGPTAEDAVSSDFGELYPSTLPELYSAIRSPSLPKSAHSLAQEILDGKQIPHFKSTLYPFQRRTVAVMAQRELAPGRCPDPIYIKMQGGEDRGGYQNTATGEVLRECPTVHGIRGGILCEEMGTGKTVMLIALILSTLDRIPTPRRDRTPVLTNLGLFKFPFRAYRKERERLAQGNTGHRLPEPVHPRVPSLTELALNLCSLQPAATKVIEAHREGRLSDRLWGAVKANRPFYHSYADGNDQLDASAIGPRLLYLSSATVVSVPDRLVGQWAMELNKHCETSELMIFQATSEDLPPPADLAGYDIILITHQRLTEEAKRTGFRHSVVRELCSWEVCKCSEDRTSRLFPENDHLRVFTCRCSKSIRRNSSSSLLHIRFKRLAHDEGQNAGNNTSLMDLLNHMKFESRWVVTGTPTDEMVGMQLGSRELAYPSSEESTHALDALEAAPMQGRAWTTADRKSLSKFRDILRFLKAPPVVTRGQGRSFATCIIKPLMKPTGPEPAAIQVLSQVMQSVMIRHRIEDIETDVLLQMLTQEAVLLDLDPLGVRTYNVLQSMLAINAVTTLRQGKQFFFDSNNEKSLGIFKQNVSQSFFWHTDGSSESLAFSNIDDTLNEGAGHILRAEEDVAAGRMAADDLELLRISLQHIESACNDRIWMAVSVASTIFWRTFRVPPAIYEAWSELDPNINTITLSEPAQHVLLSADSLVNLREIVTRHPTVTLPCLTEVADLLHEERTYYAQLDQMKKHPGGPSRRKEHERTLLELGARLKQIRERRDMLLATMTPTAMHTGTNTTQPEEAPLATEPLATEPALMTPVRVGNSTSTKLNWILKEVKEFQRDEKFLIFSDSPLTLHYIADGLQLINVAHLTSNREDGTRKSKEELQSNVLTFETSPRHRVFLMDLNVGARGLNMTSASRIIFCEPVDKPDLEMQAIKRAHRLGQTRQIIVKTLAIRGTVEEALVSRRQAVRSGSMSGQALDMPDDLIRLHFLRHPQFLPEPLPEPDRDVELDFPLLPRLRSEKRGADTFNGSADNSDGIGARLPKRRKNGLAVRFAPMDSNLVEL